MDRILHDRYTILIANYLVDSRLLAELRNDIMENLHGGDRLRPDAALILIVLFDQMIIRPYHGSLHGPFYDRWAWPEEVNFPLPLRFRAMDDQKFLEACKESLRKIIGGAKKEDDDGISSHSILKSIDQNWPYLSEMFGWG